MVNSLYKVYICLYFTEIFNQKLSDNKALQKNP